MLRKLRYTIVFICLGGSAFGQLLPLLDQYNHNGLAINPAYSGSQDALSIGLHSRTQWVGFEGAPKTFTFSAHSPMKNRKVNLGVIVLSDRLGSKQESGLLLNYAYRMDLRRGKLSFGLAAGVTNLSYNLNSIRYTDLGDKLLQEPGRSAILPAFSIGGYYYTKKYFIGMSLPLLMSHKVNQENGKYWIHFDPSIVNYVLNAGYVFRISEDFEIFPSFLLKSSPAAATQLDLLCNVIFREEFTIGTSIRTNGNLSGMLQVQVNPQFKFAYSYGYELGRLSSYQNGTHELTLFYNFKYIIEVISPRYF